MLEAQKGEVLQKRDIEMNDAKENPTGFVAYLSYVRDLWGVSNKVSRSIAKFCKNENFG